jgi:hypothetical protein
MRKLLGVLVLLFGCLTFVGQAVASAASPYHDCCMQGCKGMTHCASAACQNCASPATAPPAAPLSAHAAAPTSWPVATTHFAPGASRAPWCPPD